MLINQYIDIKNHITLNISYLDIIKYNFFYDL